MSGLNLRMPISRRTDGYWITEVPLADCAECGPYHRKGDAEEDRRGLRRWFKHAKQPLSLVRAARQEVA